MANRAFPQTVRKYLTTAETHGVKLPRALKEVISTRLELIETANRIDITGPTVAEAAYNAISNGQNPLDDPEVTRAIARSTLAPVVQQNGVANVATDKLEETIREHIEELAAAYQHAYNNAGERFTAAHATLTASGITSLNDPRVSTMGLDTAKANLDAREANRILHDLHEALTTLLLAVGRLESTPVGGLLVNVDAGDATAPQILAAFHGNRRAEPWDIASAGYRISLATPTEAKARAEHAYSNHIASNREANRDHAQEARAAAYARSMG